MDKYKKLIILLSVVCLSVIIICSMLLIFSKNNNKESANLKDIASNNGTTEIEDNVEYVQEVTNPKTTYNVGVCINNMIEDCYYTGKYENTQALYLPLPYELIQKLDYENGLKSYYIEKAYKADMKDDITLYFTKGYIVNEHAEQIQKEEILLTFINDTEYNTGIIQMYGKEYTDKIKYNDDISKTIILDTSGYKIKKAESKEKQSLEEVMIEEEIYQNRNLDGNIPERDLVYWYYKDYKINQANNNRQKLELQGFLYDGNFSDGYTIIEIDGTEYFIKPGNIPMEYEMTVK